MKHRYLGESGIQASAVGLGAWAIGGWYWGGTDEQDSIRAVHAALDAGMNFIDTAPAYGLGRSEGIIGKALRGRRDEVVLATKCGLVWDSGAGAYFFDEFGKAVHKYLGPESIRYEVEQSLRRLNTDFIDLYQTHWQDSTTPIHDTMSALQDLKAQGKIRAIGVSNADCKQMDEYRAVGPIAADQEKYSMLDRQMDLEQLDYCQRNNIAFLAYSPLAQGLLTGAVRPDRTIPQDDLRSRDGRFCSENRDKILNFLEGLAPVAEAHNATDAQVAIAWTLARPGVTHALVGARNPMQVQENAVGADIALTEDEIRTIDTCLSTLCIS